MNYLLYYIEGFIRKFPLDKPRITIGRSGDNDMVIAEDFVSRNHVEIIRQDDSVVLQDLGSTNGIIIAGEKVKKARLKTGGSFILGKMEFVLKQGSLDEFELDKKLIPIFDTIGKENYKRVDSTRTRYVEDVYNETLKALMQAGLKKNDFDDFVLDLPNHLSNLADFGSMYIITQNQDSFDILLSVRNESVKPELLKQVVMESPAVYNEKQSAWSVPGTNVKLFSYPLHCFPLKSALVFMWSVPSEKEEPKLEAFLSALVVEIELLAQLLTSKEKEKTKEKPTPKPVKTAEEPSDKSEKGVNIIAENSRMKERIQQAKKIAASDIFVLIQGESGTGKELFARLIHQNSSRKKKKFVAINCAAIPEQLLESELFGHEKGAFTSAYTKKNGKLEMASGGTLVLDEIGDMPMNLQAKLLRALQENEFYRVGGTTPISVDLRIISITNKDLKQLISENKFREDLYYRLVHRVISIPPLRERKEDVTVLINHFTQHFCRQTGKSIKGYTVKAANTLENYHWKGNVRQLENEVRSIVNLTDHGESVTYEILSEEVKEQSEDPTSKIEETPKTTEMHPIQIPPIPIKLTPEQEKAQILDILQKNRWNKSQAARILGMTYRGLHKKMKRLGIQ